MRAWLPASPNHRVPAAQIPERIVSGWFDAFNARDLNGLLMLLDPHVEFHPLRLGGLAGSYRGHGGVRDWWADVGRQHGEHQVGLSNVRSVGDGMVFAVGSLRFVGESDIGPFCALHRIRAGLIVAAHHCVGDPQ